MFRRLGEAMANQFCNPPFTCVWIALLVCTFAHQSAPAALTVDLRAVSTTAGVIINAKEVLFTGGIGDKVVMDIYGKVTGSNSNPDDDWIGWVHGSFLTSFGGPQGDLRTTLVGGREGWNGVFASLGLIQDLDGDGDLDVGSNFPENAANYFRTDRREETPYVPETKFGTLTWTCTSGLTGGLTLNFRTRDASDGDGAAWLQDGFGQTPLTNDYRAGSAVILSVTPEPNSTILVFALLLIQDIVCIRRRH
jgi:hypothetical protein